jgi:ketosteroid isomerase-like protein
VIAATDFVRELYEAYQRRDWGGAAELLHPDATLAMPSTRERLAGREEVIGFQRDYPEPWGELTVFRVVGGGDEACAEIEVVGPEQTFRLAAFWRAEGALLRDGIEYWVTVGGEQPPPDRAPTY